MTYIVKITTHSNYLCTIISQKLTFYTIMSELKKDKKHIDVLHFEHQVWTSELNFYKDELVIFDKRLGEMVNNYTDKEVLGHLEHFQNQFIIQNQEIVQLLHDSREHEEFLAFAAQSAPIAIDHQSFADHAQLRDRMEQFTKLYMALKQEFKAYLSKIM